MKCRSLSSPALMPTPIEFPPELPISSRVKDIAQAINDHPVIIVAGATGSGKTTQLPKIALAMGRGLDKIIGVTQPRRLAATSVAERVAAELGTPLGTDVGYQVRFDDRTSASTYVKFMTDGILLAEIQGDPLLRKYDTIVIDEAHERSLTIDFLLGWLRRILPERPDLKVIVSSATLETSKFSEFFGGAPVIEVEGRTFPVEVLYEPPDEDDDLPEAVGKAIENVTSLDPRGDILVFLPGEREIRDVESDLNARRLRHTVVQPLYARLSGAEQRKVFQTIPERRVILATNVAETSVTIPGIVYVVDTGIARLSRYDARSGTTRLQIEAISKASADQRKGRCGRVREGICVRLYDEQSWASRVDFTDPEIKRTGLAGVILRMKSLGLGEVESFPFLDPPDSRAITEGYRVLEELGALDATKSLTEIGKKLARFPVDPRIGRMILGGIEHKCLADVLVIAAALNAQDPRERPRDKVQKADELHRRFKDERSDFIGLLRLWEFVQAAGGGNPLRRLCRENFLSWVRVREWMEIHRQLEEIVEAPKTTGEKKTEEDALHRALLTGLLSKVGYWNPESRVYIGAKQTRFAVHPSSAVVRKPPQWVMAFELVETSQLFARTVAKINPEWLVDAAAHLLKRSWSDPHWSERAGRASVKENITLYGLSIARDVSVDYAKVAPVEARKMFLDHALVRGEYRSRGAFQETNRKLLEEVARLRDKARRSDMIADDEALLSFFDAKVPAEVVDGKSFETWREKVDDQTLCLTVADVLVGDRAIAAVDYPDVITLHGAKVPVLYKFEPSADDDGITLTVPLVLLPQIDPGELDWTIPGWHRDKLTALLYELPKSARRGLGDVPALAAMLAKQLTPFDGPMLPALARAVSRDTDAEVSSESFRPDLVASYLRLTLRVTDGGRVIDQGKDIDGILRRHGARARAAWSSAVKTTQTASWERTCVTAWDFPELPRFLVRRVVGTDVRSYPAIVDKITSVDLALLESEAAAEAANRTGVRRLLLLGARQTVSAITPRLPAKLPRASGGLPSRVETEAFRADVLLAIADLAFPLTELPRTKTEYDALLAAGLPRLNGAHKVVVDALAPVATELVKTIDALRSAGKHPSGRVASDEMHAQLELLVPTDIMRRIPLARLAHYPRYFRAMQARLGRAITDPRKDASKVAPFTPLWKAFLLKQAKARDPEAAEDLRWIFEELRVAIFAPELRTPIPINVAKVNAALLALK